MLRDGWSVRERVSASYFVSVHSDEKRLVCGRSLLNRKLVQAADQCLADAKIDPGGEGALASVPMARVQRMRFTSVGGPPT